MRNPSTSSSSATNKSTPCCSKVGVKRGPWTPEEDELLSNYIKKEGEGKWRTLPKRAGLLRCGKSCRLRWMNYLRPSVKRGQIAPDEEDLILRLHRLLGNRWSLIAGRIPGRTDNEIKNYWNTHLSKKLISQGIDPRTHKPLNQVPSSSADHQAINKASSSSKANKASTSNPNSHPVIVVPSELDNQQQHHTNDHSRMMISSMMNKESGSLPNTLADHDEYQNEPNIGNGYTNFLINCDHDHQLGLVLGSNNDDDEDINYCTDDAFSSFLNSLINEDDFASNNNNHNQQLQQQLPNGSIAMAAAATTTTTTGLSDPLVSIRASTFGIAASMESQIMPSSFNQNEPKRDDEHVE